MKARAVISTQISFLFYYLMIFFVGIFCDYCNRWLLLLYTRDLYIVLETVSNYIFQSFGIKDHVSTASGHVTTASGRIPFPDLKQFEFPFFFN